MHHPVKKYTSLSLVIVIMISTFLFFISKDNVKKEIPSVDLQIHHFIIEGKQFELLLPIQYKRNDGTGTLLLTTKDTVVFDTGGRLMHYLRFSPVNNHTDLSSLNFSEVLKLRNHNTFYYNISENGSGSGGAEEKLTGIINFPDLEIQVECSDQSEMRPEPKWCLPYLNELKLK